VRLPQEAVNLMGNFFGDALLGDTCRGLKRNAEKALRRTYRWALGYTGLCSSFLLLCDLVYWSCFDFTRGNFTLLSKRTIVLLLTLVSVVLLAKWVRKISIPTRHDLFLGTRWIVWRFVYWWTGINDGVEALFMMPNDNGYYVHFDSDMQNTLRTVPSKLYRNKSLREAIRNIFLGRIEFYSRKIMQAEAWGYSPYHLLVWYYRRRQFSWVYKFANACGFKNLPSYGVFLWNE